jgi:diketogulonate reductase-like aldo/keto reductase
MKPVNGINRRQFYQLVAGLVASQSLPVLALAEKTQIYKTIASSGEKLPVIGMGTSRTFDAIGDQPLLEQLLQVTQLFFAMGGSLIDSSPMYGSSEQVIGELLSKLHTSNKSSSANVFAASKVWTEGRQEGIQQMEHSRQLWSIPRFDLMQIHNLMDWKIQLETLNQMKADGKIRYTGITTSHGRDHQQLAKILTSQPLDFVQLSYNIGSRDVEEPLLSIARDKGTAVLVNRPYQRGQLFKAVKGKQLPGWAADIDCASWGQFFLKFCVSHPAVTCAIPATSSVKHMQDNMLAGKGRLPTAKQRRQMLDYFQSL